MVFLKKIPDFSPADKILKTATWLLHPGRELVNILRAKDQGEQM
jgi:hypothetical protein